MEDLFCNHHLATCEKEIEVKVDCQKEFGRTKGLHRKFEKTTRVQVRLMLEKIHIKREVVSDWTTGKTVRASLAEIGPEKSKITWEMLAWLCEYVVHFCIPIDRIAKMISFAGNRFSSGRICEWLAMAAKFLLPIYLYLAEQLSEANELYGDDSRTNVVELRQKIADDSIGSEEEKIEELVKETATILPRVSKVKSGKRNKKQISISTLIGKSDPLDARSTIYFYRTHVGDLGNLLSHLLAMRRRKNRQLKLVTDLLSANKPDENIIHLFDVIQFGCGSHARRPFYRFRQRDPELCYYILRAFALLAKIEKNLDHKGRTKQRILYARRKYSKKVWLCIEEKCRETVNQKQWPPGSVLFDACKYILSNFDKLTKYIDHPEIEMTNNNAERILRPDKIMLVASKFRFTEKGRVVIDILRTITMTCSAAQVPISKYLIYVFIHNKDAKLNPEKYTPFAFAKKIQQENYPIAG